MLFHLSSSPQSADELDYLNSLRLSILEAYSGILLGLSDGKKGFLFVQFLDNVLAFFELMTADPDVDDLVMGHATAILGYGVNFFQIIVMA